MTQPASDDDTTRHSRDDTTDVEPLHEPLRELPPPRFNPLYFGIVAATIQMALLLWLWLG